MALCRHFRWPCLFLLAFCITVAPFPSFAQTPWQTPPQPIQQILDAPLPPAVTISPNHRWFVAVERPPLSPIAELAQPQLALAGLQIDPQTHAPADHYTFSQLTYRAITTGEVKTLDLPQDARLGFFDWSLDGNRLAFTLTQSSGLELWVLDLPSEELRRLSEPILNATYGDPCHWLPGEEGLLCKVVPENRDVAPTAPSIPTGPFIEENLGRKAPARTYTNLLKNPHDEALLEYYLTSSLERISLNGDRQQILAPTLIEQALPSPNGEFILLKTIHRPFSYQVPISRFPEKVAVLNLAGQPLYNVADLPLADNIPIPFGSVREGRRWVDWRADRGATLYWVEALDGGDAGQAAERRDEVFELDAPFTASPQTLWQSQYRFGGLAWGREDVALAWEWWYDNRQERIWQIDPQSSSTEAQLLVERNYQDQYSDPGQPLMMLGPYGKKVLRFTPDGNSIYFEGKGASPRGVYPFLEQRSLLNGEIKRLWQAQESYYERVEDVLDDRAEQIIVRRQSQSQPPNYFLLDLHNHQGKVTHSDHSASIQLTNYQDPAPQFAEVRKDIIQYEREDGVQLSAELYLPPGYNRERDGPLPALFWVYPQEFKDADTAGQLSTPEHTFSRPYGFSVLFFLLQGYAVVDNPKLPIIGEENEEPNDTYVEQLVMGAKAAVEAVTQRGIIDGERLVVGGHSYGAFTTANLLAHSDLFRAGIATSGAYNRTLTPFGFQGEQRSFWEAPETYMRMSPFTHADKIDEPLLLIHGMDDSNIGTYPVQSERLFEALKGLGGTVRWVQLPHEDHGYRGRETIAHALWEMIRWCDRYVSSR